MEGAKDLHARSANSYFAPQSRYPILKRRRIVEQARRSDPALIVLHGGLGTGKTTVAAEITRALVADGVDVVWVRFDNDRSGLADFWQSVVESLAASGAIPGGSMIHRLAAGGVSTMTPQLLVDALGEVPNNLAIVFRDFQLVATREIEESLLNVLESALRLTFIVITSNRQPRLASASARIRVPVRVFTAEDLSFTQDETTELFTLRSHPSDSVDPHAVGAAIYAATAGWPLAVHALILEHAAHVNYTHPREHSSFVSEYIDHFFSHSSIEIQEALCAAAQFEEVTAPVLAAMLETSIPEAEDLLANTAEALASYWVDEDGRGWYRHHEMVRTELEKRATGVIGTERLRTMHLRAAQAYRTIRPLFALHAALQAEAWVLLSELLVETGGGGSNVQVWPKKRLQDIPEAVRQKYPILAAFALIDGYAFPTGRFEQVVTGLKLLASRTFAVESSKKGPPGLVAATLRMIAARLSGNETLSVRMAERSQEAMAQLSHEEISYFAKSLGRAVSQTGITFMHAGRFDDVHRVLQPVDRLQAETKPDIYAHASAQRAWAFAWSGEMAKASEYLKRCMQIDVPVGWHSGYIGTGYRLAAAVEHLEQGELDQAQAHLDALAEHEPTIEHWPFLSVIRALITESRVGATEALIELQHQMAKRHRRFSAAHTPHTMLLSLKARLEWQTGRPIARIPRKYAQSPASIYSALRRGETSVARVTISELLTADSTLAQPRLRAELLLLRAECAHRERNAETAVHDATEAIGILQRYGMTLPLRVLPRSTAIALANDVTGLDPLHSAPSQRTKVQLLSPAEQRALVAIAEHQNVSAAADALFVSRDTVKTHLRNVYRKLEVNNRTDAIRVASEIGLFTTSARLSQEDDDST